MHKKFLSLMLIGLLLNIVGVCPASASAQDDKEARRIEKVKANVRKLGTGVEARVEVKLLDNKKVKGYIKEMGEDSFVIVDEKASVQNAIAYAQVKQLKGRNGLTAAKVAINAAKGAAIVAAVAGATMLLMLLIIPKT
jgi:hypothetical protein